MARLPSSPTRRILMVDVWTRVVICVVIALSYAICLLKNPTALSRMSDGRALVTESGCSDPRSPALTIVDEGFGGNGGLVKIG